MRKKFIGFLIVIILMIIGSMAMRLANESTEDTESIENVENTERTDEEYISIFLDNREDFEYVAEIMQKWDLGRIYFKKEDMINGNSEIAEEITTNEEFYIHLKNLYNLKEVHYIIVEGNNIVFYFWNFPKDYHGGIVYGEELEADDFIRYKIDENWFLEIIPNV